MSFPVFARVFALAVLVLAVPAFSPVSLAAGSHKSEHGHGDRRHHIGRPGDAAQVTRTIEILMYDNYYEPDTISIERGETVRFRVRNAGEYVHEFSIGTATMHVAHQPEMRKMVEHGVLEADRINWDAAKAMEGEMGHGMHEDPNSVLLEPGQTGEIVWNFQVEGELELACNVPGHYQAGMTGTIEIFN